MQVLWLDTAMMRPFDPSLQIAEDEMNHGQVRLCLVGIAAKRQRVVMIPIRGQFRIAGPSVRPHCSANRNILFDEARQRVGASVWHDTKSQPSSVDAALVLLAVCSRPNLYRADNDRLVMNSAPFAARLTE